MKTVDRRHDETERKEHNRDIGYTNTQATRAWREMLEGRESNGEAEGGETSKLKTRKENQDQGRTSISHNLFFFFFLRCAKV